MNLDDFIKKSSVISYSREALLNNGRKIISMARHEGWKATPKR